MTVFTWSATAADNDDADGTINCREGQAPSTINDSMRAIMAAIAKWRDDMSGNLVTAGTSTAYTLTTNQVYTALTDGIAVTCRMSATNGATPTLNVDSLGAKSIASVYGTAVPSGRLLSGSVQTFVYDSTDDKWIVQGQIQHDIPSGTIMLVYANTAPTGWTIAGAPAAGWDDKGIKAVSGTANGGTEGGIVGGTTAWSSVMTARTITASNLPDHSITITDPGHTHNVLSCTDEGPHPTGTGRQDVVDQQTRTTTSATTGITAAFGTAARGGAQTTMDFDVYTLNYLSVRKD